MDQITTWVVGAIQPYRPDALVFSEYLHMVCYFSLLSVTDIVKLIFGQVDARDNYFIRFGKLIFDEIFDRSFSRDQMIFIIRSLWGSGEGYRIYLKTFRGLNDPNKIEFTLEDLLDFCQQNPSIMKTMLRIQVKQLNLGALTYLVQQAFIKKNLGDAYWLRKSEQFKAIREEIGAVML